MVTAVAHSFQDILLHLEPAITRTHPLLLPMVALATLSLKNFNSSSNNDFFCCTLNYRYSLQMINFYNLSSCPHWYCNMNTYYAHNYTHNFSCIGVYLLNSAYTHYFSPMKILHCQLCCRVCLFGRSGRCIPLKML